MNTIINFFFARILRDHTNDHNVSNWILFESFLFILVTFERLLKDKIFILFCKYVIRDCKKKNSMHEEIIFFLSFYLSIGY